MQEDGVKIVMKFKSPIGEGYCDEFEKKLVIDWCRNRLGI